MTEIEDTVERDRIARVYYGEVSDPETQRRARARIAWTLDQVPDGHVLDVGCSEGILALELVRRGRTVLGVDIHRDALAYAADLLQREEPGMVDRARFVLHDMLAADAGDLGEEFDCVVLGEVIEHVHESERLLENSARGLRPGTVVVITTPYGHAPAPDHHRTFVLTSFLDALPANVAVTELTVADGYIRCRGEVVEEGVTTRAPDCATLLDESEAGVLVSQRHLYSVLDRKDAQLATGRDRAAALVQQREELGSRLAEARDRINALEQELATAIRHGEIEVANERRRLTIESANERRRMEMDFANERRQLQLRIDAARGRDPSAPSPALEELRAEVERLRARRTTDVVAQALRARVSWLVRRVRRT